MNRIILVLILVFISTVSFSQRYVESIPEDIRQLVSYDTLVLIKTETKANTISSKLEGEAFEFGQTIKITHEDLNKGFWSELKDGNYNWRFIIEIKDAGALNIYFSDLQLSKNEELYIHSHNNKNQAIKVDYNNQRSRFGTSLFYDDLLIIDFISKNKRELPFTIREVGYSNSNPNDRDFGGSGDCEVSINCPEGENYNLRKNSVSRILVKQNSSLYWCSGSLINNTKKDGTPYLLTANHCGKASSTEDYTDWVFDFNFESPDCDRPVFEPEKQTIYGSTVVANAPDNVNSFSDFKLLLLSEDIPSTFKPYFIGWDRSTSASITGVSIHHPQGDIKMISTYTEALTSTSYFNENENPDGLYWKVNWTETESGHGVTEGGSSGSPIYNQQGLLIGTLTGGNASCTFLEDPDWYGKFSYHWESNGNDSTTQLKYWLDPLNSDNTFLNGTNLDSSNVSADFTTSSRSVNIGGEVEFINMSVGNITNYKWYFEGGTPETSDLKDPANVKYYNLGSFDVKLIVESASGADSIAKSDYIKVESYASPSPTNGPVKIKVGELDSSKINLDIFDTYGNKLSEIIEPVKDDEGFIHMDLSMFESGLYIIRLNLDGFDQTYKVLLIK